MGTSPVFALVLCLACAGFLAVGTWMIRRGVRGTRRGDTPHCKRCDYVLIGIDGTPQKVEISKSSGFDRLDRQAQEAVMRWRFVPGKRNGVPETMWNLVPVNFVLE